MVTLSLRLSSIHDLVSKQSIVADIGSDHGKLMISLFYNGIIKKGYAVENKVGPFNRLKRALEEHKVISNITPLFNDGLNDLPDDVNTLVIAGMGGSNIVDILIKNTDKLKNINEIIVDPHNAIPEVRKQIVKLGYRIYDEKIIKEDSVFYEIIKFKKEIPLNYDEFDYLYGPILRKEKNQIFIEKYQTRINEIENLINNVTIPNAKKELLTKEKEELSKII